MHVNRLSLLHPAVIVSALGYFVDAFDILIFGAVRLKTLRGLGLEGQSLTDATLSIQSWQMAGMFVGGIGAGILADRIGRVRALYFSIALYSVATMLCGMASSVEAFLVWRTIAGIGLAGELGTGVTLVVESLPQRWRGLGATIMASFGMLGAAAAGTTGWWVNDWRHAYYIGGALGLLLLALRLSVGESPIFERALRQEGISRGNFLAFFSNFERFSRLVKCSLLGITTWFNVGILMTLSPEFGAAKGLVEPVDPALAVVFFHVGMVAGDAAAGLLSQWLRSRLRALRWFLWAQAVCVAAYLFVPFSSAAFMYVMIVLLGFAGGYWAVFITHAAEQFGTNLRATAAGAAPALVRIAFVPISTAFQGLKAPSAFGDPLLAAAAVGGACIGLALLASIQLEDPFAKNLDYVERKAMG
ncbi:MAG: MFS transporter [Saprospiraceae bacterium]|nr:MFS transporter [Saprospiraceae bacterium]MDW8484028.1 MFS transporter [Saprospiraceae bacterium]